MKVSDIIIKLIEQCDGNLNRDLLFFKMEETGFVKGIPKVSFIYEFQDGQNIIHDFCFDKNDNAQI